MTRKLKKTDEGKRIIYNLEKRTMEDWAIPTKYGYLKKLHKDGTADCKFGAKIERVPQSLLVVDIMQDWGLDENA